MFSPITGKVAEINSTLKDGPQFINEDPYGKGWIVRMEVQKKEELKGLLLSKTYEGSLKEELQIEDYICYILKVEEDRRNISECIGVAER